MGVRAVFFDFGGTLAEQIVDPVDVWFELANALGLPNRREDVERALEAAHGWFHDAVFEYLGRNEELWRQYGLRVLGALGVGNPREGLIEAIQSRFGRVRWNRVFPEAPSVLEGLRARGFILHVVSNATDEVLDRIRDVGLAKYFDGVTSSQEAGANKPDTRPFLIALRKTGCAPGEAIHVGNTYEEDVVGARAAGIAPVLVDRSDRRPDADCPRVRDLRGVVSFVP